MPMVITACMKPDGTPTFVRTEVVANEDEVENGIHYYLAEALVLERGFEEPMVHFGLEEAPAFLLAAQNDIDALDSELPIPTYHLLSESL